MKRGKQVIYPGGWMLNLGAPYGFITCRIARQFEKILNKNPERSAIGRQQVKNKCAKGEK